MSEPTKAEEKWFWGQCGFKKAEPSYKWGIDDSGWGWLFPSGNRFKELPPIDLNNLFKYAVPFLDERYDEVQWLLVFTKGIGWEVSIYAEEWIGEAKDKDLALALFGAIYKALGGVEK